MAAGLRVDRRQFGGLALSSLAAAGCTQREGTERIFFAADSHPAGYPTVEAVRSFGEDISKRTNGRLKVQSYPGGQLGSEGSTLEIAMFGGLDLTRVFSAALNNIAPTTRVLSLPFLFRSTGHLRAMADGAVGREILASLEPHGLHGLAIYDGGARGFYTTGTPIAEPAALRGLKIRVPNSDILLETVRALGANPTPMNYGEVYQGLVQKVVDGAENNWPSFVSSRHAEVARYYSETRHAMAPDFLVMSKRSWDRLARADQDLVQEAATASMTVQRALWDQRVMEAKESFKKSGGTIVENIDQGPFRAEITSVYERFAGPDIAPIISAIEALEDQA